MDRESPRSFDSGARPAPPPPVTRRPVSPGGFGANVRKVRQSCPRRRVTPRAPAAMAFTPAEFHLTLRPRRRFEAIDVNEKIAAGAGGLLPGPRRTPHWPPDTLERFGG